LPFKDFFETDIRDFNLLLGRAIYQDSYNRLDGLTAARISQGGSQADVAAYNERTRQLREAMSEQSDMIIQAKKVVEEAPGWEYFRRNKEG